MTQRASVRGHAAGRHDAPDGALVELWLRRSLSDSYGLAVAEPLPPELERLVAAVPEREHDA